MTTKLDNKEVIGVIVNNEDDPDRMGRCQVYFPFMGTKVNLPDLPWLQCSSPSNNDGPLSFNRPPSPGTMVSVLFGSGTGSVNGIIKSVFNGIHAPEALTGIDLTKVLPGLSEALNFKPDMNGPPDISSVSKSNETCAEKITTEITDKPITSMSERVGLPSNLVTKALVPLYDAVSEVSTALENVASSMTPALGAMIPGTNLNLSLILSQIDTSQYESKISSAIQNFANVLTSSSPLSGTNFAQIGKKMGESAIENIASQLQSVANFSQLEDVISKVKTNADDILDTASLDNISLKIDGPFGKINVSLSASGKISISLDDVVEKLVEAFTSSISTISTVTGELLGNSEIMDMFERLPLNAQSTFKTALESIPSELSTAFTRSNEFFSGS